MVIKGTFHSYCRTCHFQRWHALLRLRPNVRGRLARMALELQSIGFQVMNPPLRRTTAATVLRNLLACTLFVTIPYLSHPHRYTTRLPRTPNTYFPDISRSHVSLRYFVSWCIFVRGDDNNWALHKLSQRKYKFYIFQRRFFPEYNDRSVVYGS